jgi:hypothetical protein
MKKYCQTSRRCHACADATPAGDRLFLMSGAAATTSGKALPPWRQQVPKVAAGTGKGGKKQVARLLH